LSAFIATITLSVIAAIDASVNTAEHATNIHSLVSAVVSTIASAIITAITPSVIAAIDAPIKTTDATTRSSPLATAECQAN
jgi:hypothetical protein